MVVLGMNTLVHGLHLMDTLKCWSGPKRMVVLGMQRLVLILHRMDIEVSQREWLSLWYKDLLMLQWMDTLKCWSGPGEWMSLDVDTCLFATKNGHFEVLKWVRENGCPDEEPPWSAERAKENGCPGAKWTEKNSFPQNCQIRTYWKIYLIDLPVLVLVNPNSSSQIEDRYLCCYRRKRQIPNQQEEISIHSGSFSHQWNLSQSLLS